ARFRGHAVVVVAQQRGRSTAERVLRNFGMPRPEGYRKAVRLFELAERFVRPVITLIDTQGAYPGIGAEERGQAEAIAASRRARPCSSAARSSATSRRSAAYRPASWWPAATRATGASGAICPRCDKQLLRRPGRARGGRSGGGPERLRPGGLDPGRPLRGGVRVAGEDEHRDEAAETPDERRERCELHVHGVPLP